MSAADWLVERTGAWRVWMRTVSAMPAADWIALVERLAASAGSLHRSKHADTYRVARPGGEVYVKVYRRYRRWTALKDWFRPSKAAHVRLVSAALTAKGFVVPEVLAAGEERRGVALGRSFCATAALGGEPIAERITALTRGAASIAFTGGADPTALARGINPTAPARGADPTALTRGADPTALTRGADPTALRAKRGLLTRLGREVARLHDAGVVAGDLVPANVWIALAEADLAIAFLDHDRTEVGRVPAAWRRARRNLVQLNRVVVAGVSSADRMRVYRAYAGARGWSRADARRRLPWIVAKTLARRRAERARVAIPPAADLRVVMRAGGPYDGGRR